MIFGRPTRTAPELDAAARARLARWNSLERPELQHSVCQGRHVVVDVEASGLDIERDWLTGIGAVAVTDGQVRYDDAFEVGIAVENTGAEGRHVLPPAAALLDFLDYLGAAPLIGFHVAFSETMLKKALQQHLGEEFRARWIDLAYAVPALYPAEGRRLRTLEQWTGHFGIREHQRHRAMSDALAIADLFLIAARKARSLGNDSWPRFRELEQVSRWVNWAR